MWNKNYIQLKKGEIIKEGDEVGNISYNEDGSMKWEKATCIGSKAPDPQFTSHRWYRRLKIEK
jgi:hypothetical protein